MLKQALTDDELDGIAGGISISRFSDSSGVVHFNGQDYPFTNYQGLVTTTQNCVAAGQCTDDELFAAFKAAGLI